MEAINSGNENVQRTYTADQIAKILDHIKDDKLLHLAIHIGFVCSLREGEVAGIDLKESSLWIIRQVQRVSDAALKEIPKDELLKVFPKKVANSKSSLILKKPKTVGSHRKQYITTPLVHEIAERIQQIQRCKDFFQEEYQDHGLLICKPDGRLLIPAIWFVDSENASRKWEFPKKNELVQQLLQGLLNGAVHAQRSA